MGENCDIVSTLYYASPPCKITAMNLLKKIKLDIFHTFMILDWLATFFPQSDRVKFCAHSENTSGVRMLVYKSHRDLCESIGANK